MPPHPVPIDPTQSVSSWFAAEVRRYREKAGWSQAELAARLYCSEQKVGHLETGYRAPADIDICKALDRVFDLDGHFTGMYPLIRREQLPDVFWKFLEAESEATAIKIYETQVIPGLLQTEAYAREISLAAHAKLTPEDRVATRMERQRMLEGKNPPRLWILLDAPVLRRMVGGPEVMKEQYEHLLMMAERPNIVIQVIPDDTHVHAGLGGSFQVFTLRDGVDVGWSEAPGIGWFFDQPDAVRDLAVRFDLIRASALPVEATLDLIRRLLEQL